MAGRHRRRTVRRVARALREQVAGGVYHVVARGVDRCDVYRDPDDRRLFLAIALHVFQRTEAVPRAYCLMTTHYHLVLETRQPNIAAVMQHLNGRYAQLFNERHGRSGHLFGARYWASVIETDEQFTNTCIYVIHNPVRAGLCDTWSDWPWSRLALHGSCLRAAWRGSDP